MGGAYISEEEREAALVNDISKVADRLEGSGKCSQSRNNADLSF